jgi:hypothetical protein
MSQELKPRTLMCVHQSDQDCDFCRREASPVPSAAWKPQGEVIMKRVGGEWPDFMAPQRLFTPDDVLYTAPAASLPPISDERILQVFAASTETEFNRWLPTHEAKEVFISADDVVAFGRSLLAQPAASQAEKHSVHEAVHLAGSASLPSVVSRQREQ